MISLPSVAAVFFFATLTIARAQEQEGKLMKRLLKPDMALQNGAQSKRFDASGSTVMKSAPTKTFNFVSRIFARNFSGVQTVHPQEFHTTTARSERTEANLHTRTTVTGTRAPFRTANYSGVTAASDATKAASTTQFTERDRAFLIRGKSQKSLSAQDRPLTIEEVRELLNKNK